VPRVGRRFVPAPEDASRPRLFFAVPLPDEVREAIRPVRDAVQAAVGEEARIRWVRIESLHLTLRFLGPTPLEQVPALGRGADAVAAAHGPFEVTLAGAGAFPTLRRPRTLWLGLGVGADGLTGLAAGLDAALAAELGPGERRPFSPHLTIARTDGLRQGAEAARALTVAAADREWSFTADRIVLFRSHLGGGPARYEALWESRLGS
jgi:2'-5' RNA ligase